MSGLLKAGLADARSRPFGPSAPADATPVPLAELDPFAPYERRIAELEAELLGLERALPEALETAREEGRQAGLEERDDSAKKKLALIEAGIGEARIAWAHHLEAMNSLSVQIARSVLQKMTGNPDWHGDFLARAIAARLAMLDASAVVAVRLSPEDISTEEIAALNASAKVPVEVGRELEAGQCMIALTMGEIALGPAAQWREVATLLDSLCDEPC